MLPCIANMQKIEQEKPETRRKHVERSIMAWADGRFERKV